MAQARALLERAVACDPGYAKATALIALTHYFDVRFNYTPSIEESKRKYAELTSRALQLDPDEPYAILMRSGLSAFEGRFDEALEDMRLALAKSPNDAYCWLRCARILINTQQPIEAEQAIRHAMRLNPFYPIHHLSVLGDALAHQGRSEEAIEAFKGVLNRQPKYMPAYLHLAALYSSIGELALARAAATEVLRIDPHYTVTAAASFYLSVDDNRKRAFLDNLRSAGLPD
jgi:adenylate cyclase